MSSANPEVITLVLETQRKILVQLNKLSDQQTKLSDQQTKLSDQQTQLSDQQTKLTQRQEDFAKTLGFINEERGRRIIDDHYPAGYSLGLKLISIGDVELLFRHMNASTNTTALYSERLKYAVFLNMPHLFFSIAEKLTIVSIVDDNKSQNEKTVVEISKVLPKVNKDLKLFQILTQTIKNDKTRSSSASGHDIFANQEVTNEKDDMYELLINSNEQSETACVVNNVEKTITCTPLAFYILRNINTNFNQKEKLFSLSNVISMVKKYDKFLENKFKDNTIKKSLNLTINQFVTATQDYGKLCEITDNEKIHQIISMDIACNSYISKYELFQELQYAILADGLFSEDFKEEKTFDEFKHLMCTCDGLLMTHKNFESVCHVIYQQLFPGNKMINRENLARFIEKSYAIFKPTDHFQSVISLRQIYSGLESETRSYIQHLIEFFSFIQLIIKSSASHYGKIRCQTFIDITEPLSYFNTSYTSTSMDLLSLNDYIFDFPRLSLELDARGGIKILTSRFNNAYETTVYATIFEIKTNMSANESLGDRAAFMGLVSLIACEQKINLKSMIIECVVISNKSDQLAPNSTALKKFLKIAQARDIKVTIAEKVYTL